MADVSVAILGLNRVGTSIGLALKRYNARGEAHNFDVSGYDHNQTTIKTVDTMKAVNSTSNRLEAIVRDKDIVIITMPYNELRTVYEIIAPNLRTGAVVIDMTPLKLQSLKWAKEYLSEGSHLVSAEPILNPKYLFDGTDETQRATEDYFDDSTILVMPSVTAIKEAVTLATDLVSIIGAEPMFFDPAEYDPLMAATRALPSVIGTAYYAMMSNSSGWDDAQRLTGADFGMLTRYLFDTHPDDLRSIWLDSSEDLVRNMDTFIATLTSMRDVIADKDQDAIEALLEDASRDYETWINRRYNNRWQYSERLDQGDSPTLGSMMGNMLGGFMPRRRDRDDN